MEGGGIEGKERGRGRGRSRIMERADRVLRVRGGNRRRRIDG